MVTKAKPICAKENVPTKYYKENTFYTNLTMYKVFLVFKTFDYT